MSRLRYLNPCLIWLGEARDLRASLRASFPAG